MTRICSVDRLAETQGARNHDAAEGKALPSRATAFPQQLSQSLVQSEGQGPRRHGSQFQNCTDIGKIISRTLNKTSHGACGRTKPAVGHAGNATGSQ